MFYHVDTIEALAPSSGQQQQCHFLEVQRGGKGNDFGTTWATCSRATLIMKYHSEYARGWVLIGSVYQQQGGGLGSWRFFIAGEVSGGLNVVKVPLLSLIKYIYFLD